MEKNNMKKTAGKYLTVIGLFFITRLCFPVERAGTVKEKRKTSVSTVVLIDIKEYGVPDMILRYPNNNFHVLSIIDSLIDKGSVIEFNDDAYLAKNDNFIVVSISGLISIDRKSLSKIFPSEKKLFPYAFIINKD